MKIVKLTLLSSVIAVNIVAMDLGSFMGEVATTNPDIIQKKKEFNTVYETLKISEGDWFLPSLDLGLGYGKSKTTYKEPSSGSVTSTNKFLELGLTENLFNGFGTVNDIEAKKATLASSAFSYIQNLNEVTLRAAKSYIDVVRNKELLALEIDNFQKHKKILSAVKVRNSSGVGIIGDLQEIEAKTNLSYSNYLTQLQNLRASQISVKKFLGKSIDINSLVSPSIGDKLNYTPSEAIKFAFAHNPALFVQKYNVIAARFNKNRDKKEFLPKVDFTVSNTYNDGVNKDTGIDNRYNTVNAGVKLNWNLFRGFKDVHTKRKNISLVHQEYQKYKAIKRNLAEEIELALSSYKMQQREYKYLTNYVNAASQKLNTITILFRNGKKSLFEFLASQTDYNSAKEKLINTKYDLLFTKLRVIKALGILSDMINPSIKASVGITNNALFDYKSLNYQADTLPLNENDSIPTPAITKTNSNDDIGFDSYCVVDTDSDGVKSAVESSNTKLKKGGNKLKKVYDEEFMAPTR